jgi:stearoyl-CoA desaturase (Delta-9 desaturase)
MILPVLRYVSLYFITIFGVYHLIGTDGLWASAFAEGSWWKLILYTVVMAHLTITAMSLSFHRHHTHKGVILNPVLDSIMQVWLWMVTSMNKADWVGVHTYHHAFSDKEQDPHSPVHKGFWHVFLLGGYDYSMAKSSSTGYEN